MSRSRNSIVGKRPRRSVDILDAWPERCCRQASSAVDEIYQAEQVRSVEQVFCHTEAADVRDVSSSRGWQLSRRVGREVQLRTSRPIWGAICTRSRHRMSSGSCFPAPVAAWRHEELSGSGKARPGRARPRRPVRREAYICVFLDFSTMGNRDTTRELLFEAALDQFGTFGFQGTTHADVAAAAGIARTTFYEYFSSTEDLLVQMVEAKLPELVEDLISGVPSDLSPRERLAGLTTRMIEFVGTDHLGLILHTEVPRLSADAQARIAKAHGGLTESFGAVYREGVASGGFRALPPALVGSLMYQVIMTAGQTVMDSAEPKKQVHEIAEAATTFLLAGLAAD